MKKSLLLLSVLPILLCLLLAVAMHNAPAKGASQAQQKNETRGAILPQPHAAIEGKAVGRVIPFKPSGDDLKAALLVHPSPELWLEFPAATGIGETPAISATGTEKMVRIDLPVAALKALSDCWEVYLSAHYNISVEPLRDANGLFKEKMRLANAIDETSDELRKSKIAAPDGTRDISYYEAEDLMERFHVMAVEVIQQGLQYKN